MGFFYTISTALIIGATGIAGYVLVVVLRLRFRYPVLQGVDVSQFPDAAKTALQPLAEELQREGFEVVALQREQASTGKDVWAVVGKDQTGSIWAVAQRASTLFSKEVRTNLILFSRLPNRRVVVTARHPLTPLITLRSWRLTHGDFPNVQAQKQTHQDAIAAQSFRNGQEAECFSDYDEFREWRQKQAQSELNEMWDRNLLANTNRGEFRFEFGRIELLLWRGIVEVTQAATKMALPFTQSATRKALPFAQSAAARLAQGAKQFRRKAIAWKQEGFPFRFGPKTPAPAASRVSISEAYRLEGNPLPQPHESRALTPPEQMRPAPVPSSPALVADMTPPPPAPRTHEDDPLGSLPLEDDAATPDREEVPPSPSVIPELPRNVHVPSELAGVMTLPSAPACAASAVAREKSRIELYREARKRSSWASRIGWSGQGVLQLLALASLLLTLPAWGELNARICVTIGVILIVHELGHCLVMRCSGLRHRAVFLLPFFGSLWNGPPKPRATSHKEFWIHLAGPFPGVVAGWALLVWSSLHPGLPVWLLDAAFWSVLLNTLFLLPFFPFDGGRIIDLVFFDRHPRLRFGWYLASGIALSPLYFVSPLLVAIPLTILAQLPVMLWSKSLTRAVMQAVRRGDSEESALLKTFQVIDRTGHQAVYRSPFWPAIIDRLLGRAEGQGVGHFGQLWRFCVYVFPLAIPMVILTVHAAELKEQRAGKLELVNHRIEALERTVQWPGSPPNDHMRISMTQLQAADAEETAAWKDKIRHAFREVETVLAKAGLGSHELHAEQIASARQLDWTRVGAWVVEDESKAPRRRTLVTRIVSSFITQAKQALEAGDAAAAERDLTVAYWALINCEPRRSLLEWQKWSELELEALDALEALAASDRLSPKNRAWFTRAVRQAPQPTGPKLALLLLRDLTARSAFTLNPSSESDSGSVEGLRARLQELGAQALESHPEQSHRVRMSNLAQHYMTALWSGEHIPDSLLVADQWARQANASPCDPARGGDPAVIESWNRRLTPTFRLARYRTLGSLALGLPSHEVSTQALDGHPVKLRADDKGARLEIEVPTSDAQSESTSLTWRVSHRLPQAGARPQ